MDINIKKEVKEKNNEEISVVDIDLNIMDLHKLIDGHSIEVPLSVLNNLDIEKLRLSWTKFQTIIKSRK